MECAANDDMSRFCECFFKSGSACNRVSNAKILRIAAELKTILHSRSFEFSTLLSTKMAATHTGPEAKHNAYEQPSHKAIDKGNPARFAPRWLVLDDTNIDLITFTASVAAVCSAFLFPSFIKLSVLVPAALILPLRLFFPRPKTPEGLVLITGASSGIGAELSYIFAKGARLDSCWTKRGAA